MLLVFGFGLEGAGLFCPYSGNVFCGLNSMFYPLVTIPPVLSTFLKLGNLDIETINSFECMALIDDDLPDSVIMETGIDRCTDLPRIENGAWNCTHGTCNLR